MGSALSCSWGLRAPPSRAVAFGGVLGSPSDIRATCPSLSIPASDLRTSSPLLCHAETDILDAVWQFCSSEQYPGYVRQLDHKIGVTAHTLAKVPFDVEYWRGVAEAAGPLPEPWSDDPTQWLFEGRPEVSTAPLQVAVARLLGYRWPEQAESDDLDGFVDPDGIVCLPSVAGEPPAAERVAAAARDGVWGCRGRRRRRRGCWSRPAARRRTSPTGCGTSSSSSTARCSATARSSGTSGTAQRDGFSALVNYHRLDRKTLEKLTYTYLGQDWVERQRAEARDEVPGAEARLAAALELQTKLEAILEGEAPLRHLRALEAAARAAGRLGARPQRRRAPQHPPVRRRRRPAQPRSTSTGRKTAARTPTVATAPTTITPPSPKNTTPNNTHPTHDRHHPRPDRAVSFGGARVQPERRCPQLLCSGRTRVVSGRRWLID